MNKMAKLIKARMIAFIEVLIKNYRLIGLDELDTIIICKLYYINLENNNILSIDTLAKEVSIDATTLANHIFDLVGKGYIDLEINEDGKEVFSLDATMEKLGNILEKEESDADISERQEKLSLIVSYIESTYARPCTASELVIINNWLDIGYLLDDIRSAVLQSVKVNKLNLKYAEAILASNKQRSVDEEIVVDDEIKALLDDAYVKK